jgi:general L-amino acid transport system permease protein
VSLWDVAFLSNRGAAIPWPRSREGSGTWMLFLLAGVAVAWAVRWWRTRESEHTGRPHHRFLWAAATFLAVAALGYLVAGNPIGVDIPESTGRGYEGGFELSPEFAALLIGLVVYTAAFIAEIIRGSILAVERGQKEAAAALGMAPRQQLRLVVLPQAMRIAIPPLNSQYLNLTKNSSLAVLIAYPDLVFVSRTIANQAGRATQVLLIAMGTYLTLSLTISFFMNVLNRAVTRKGARR